MNPQWRKLKFLLTVLALVAVFLLSCASTGGRIARAVWTPVRGTLRCCGNLCRSVREHFVPQMRQERDRYERELREAQAKLLAVEDVRRQNRELRAMLQLDFPAEWHAVSASVLSRDPATWNWKMWISLGEEDGLDIGNPVLAGSHLVGRVVALERHSAEVALLGSPQCRLAIYVRHGTENHFGVLQGEAPPLSRAAAVCGADFLPKDAAVAPGDLVCTTGLGEKLPYGIVVGTVAAQTPCPVIRDHARGYVAVRPYADMKYFEFVTVLIPEKAPETVEELPTQL